MYPPVVVGCRTSDLNLTQLHNRLLSREQVTRLNLDVHALLDPVAHLLRQVRVQTQAGDIILRVKLHADPVTDAFHRLVHALLEHFRVHHRILPDVHSWYTLTLGLIVILVVVARTVLDVVAGLAATDADVALRQSVGLTMGRVAAVASLLMLQIGRAHV